jgi:mannose/fructose/N-acetylgalactosamine-specific phosphotransferase system component IIC
VILVATMTDEGNKLCALFIGLPIALLLFVSSTIRDTLFDVICDIIDKILEPFGIIGLGKLISSLINMIPSFIEITIAYSLVIIVGGVLSLILSFMKRW